MSVDPSQSLTLSLTLIASLLIIAGAGLKALSMWITLRQSTGADLLSADPSTSSRIELADMKERLRKLEAIAAGVDL